MSSITPVNYIGATGLSNDTTLDFLGFDVEELPDEILRFWMVNHRPPVDENGAFLDAVKLGANSTIEVFDLKRGEKSMKHVKTVWDKEVWAPNTVAALGGGAFVASNDHSAKGLLFLSPLFFDSSRDFLPNPVLCRFEY